MPLGLDRKQIRSVRTNIKAIRSKLMSKSWSEQIAEAHSTTLETLFDRHPVWKYPYHLQPFCSLIDHACDPSVGPRSPVHSVVHSHAQSGKTYIALMGVLLCALRRPGSMSGYGTYTDGRLGQVYDEFKRLLNALGIGFRSLNRDIQFDNGSMIKFFFINGTLTGNPLNGLVILDDPYKGAVDAMSPAYNRRLDNWFKRDFRSRLHQQASVFVMMHRWTMIDISARLIEQGWDYLRMPAQCDDPSDPAQAGRKLGEYLLTEEVCRYLGHGGKDYEVEKRDTDVWASMWQGIPISNHLTHFQTVSTFDGVLPKDLHDCSILSKSKLLVDTENIRYVGSALGFDLAYGAMAHHDHTALCRADRWINNLNQNLVVITPLLRSHLTCDEFFPKLEAYIKDPMIKLARQDTGGTEKYTIQAWIKDWQSSLRNKIAMSHKSKSKWDFAIDYMRAWNKGFVVVKSNDLSKDFISEHYVFSGEDGASDDQVDAAASAYYAVMSLPSSLPAPRQNRTREVLFK